MASVDPSLVYDDTLAAPGSAVAPRRVGGALAADQIVGGRYRVGRLLGSGGMGLVFEGTHLELGSSVAIKIVRPQFSQDSHVLERFVNEARNVAALTSPHIARVFDAGKLHTGEAYLVMERLVGRDLASLLSESGPLPWTLATAYVAQACEGLAEAHARGVVHRDLKPEHLFVVQTGTAQPLVKILDFGISKNIRQAEARMTLPGDSIGSPLYMSPEQIQNPALVDERTDLWSLGIVLYETLTGKLPFDGDTVAQVQWQVIAEEPQPLRARCPDAPLALEQIILRCLAKSPADRFTSVNELRLALNELFEPSVQPPLAPAPAAVAPSVAAPFDPPRAPVPPAPGDASSTTGPPVAWSEARALALGDAPTLEELRAAGLPKGSGRTAAAFLGAGLGLTLIAFGSVSLGGLDHVKAWGQGLERDETPARFEPTASSWTPPLVLPILRSGPPPSPWVTPLAPPTAAPPIAAPAPPTTESQGPSPAAVAPPLKPAPDPKLTRSSRPADAAEPGLSREEIEARYRNWLEQENLVPVGEVTVDDALAHPPSP